MKLIFSLLLLTLFVIPAAAKIKTSAELIEAMRAKYEGKWYKTLTFAQNTTNFKPDGTTEKSVWYETMSLPGCLRIDFERIGSGNGVIYENGMQHDFKGGKVVGSRRTGHLLLLLGFDVYGQSALATLKQLEDMKIDSSKFHEDVLQG
ncbi:MAG: hypothetical protein M3209_17095 [Acidobacteriota bacterium]|nr:hypothetical protein [Acidobacteriota bacterium]